MCSFHSSSCTFPAFQYWAGRTNCEGGIILLAGKPDTEVRFRDTGPQGGSGPQANAQKGPGPLTQAEMQRGPGTEGSWRSWRPWAPGSGRYAERSGNPGILKLREVLDSRYRHICREVMNPWTRQICREVLDPRNPGAQGGPGPKI